MQAMSDRIDNKYMDIGDRVEDLLGVDQEGREVRLSDYPGKRVLLYFYPKDNTAGCTAQACSLRDGYAELQAAGVEVVGVSKDSARSHQRFIANHQLPFRLIVDSDVRLNMQFGVWIEKSMYGRRYMGTERTSFVISPEGIIEYVIRGRAVSTQEHYQQVLGLLQGDTSTEA